MKTRIDGRPFRTEFDRELERRNRCIERVNTIFNYAIKDQITHAEIVRQLGSRVYDALDYKRLTVAWKEYVRGWAECRFNEVWRHNVAWGFKPLGVFCETFDEVQEKYHDEIVKDRCNGFHYWKGSNGARPFTTPKTDEQTGGTNEHATTDN